ncbi:MAG TPA: hypothetical protein VFG73_00425 [Rhodanobacteraceae bacterium]|nr:hypothetical protein [Rhodanobacteraceae bacterium]
MGLFGSKEPETIEVLGKPLACTVCGGMAFHSRRAQLNTAAATFFDFDWANKSADCHVCDRCGHIHWFLPR